MSNSAPKKIGFEPLHDAHAIEQVVFAIQFDGQLDDSAFNEITDILVPLTGELPKKEPLFRANLTFSVVNSLTSRPISGVTQSTPAIPFGMMYQSVQPDGVIGNEFVVDRGSIMFRTTLYTRWAETWSRGRNYCDAILGKYLAKAGVSLVSLNYVDKFVWRGVPAECHPEWLLRPKSNYLCPYVYETTELWHSHTGAFSRVDDNTKRLMNVNIDHLDEIKHDRVQRIIAISTVLSDQLNQPGYEKFILAENQGNSFLDSKMQQLHDFGKIVFANVINDDMCKRIALNT